jgi:uncharacterized membrane protein
MLIVFPIATFSLSVLFDIMYLANGDGLFARFALWLIALGVVTGLLAAVFGLIDWMGLPSGSRAKRIGLIHGGGNVLIVGLFIISWVLRLGDPEYAPSILPFILGVAGVGLALATAWLGGELVYRLRVGVDDGANINATNSLSESGLVSTDPGETRASGGQATTRAASR